jgi:Sec7-like guanine-nucleotide exchange factor
LLIFLLDSWNEEGKAPDDIRARSIRTFNRNPKKGVKLLKDNGICDPSPAGMANFLRQEKSLKKTAIGQFIGDK